MRLLSVQVGQPREVHFERLQFQTSFFKLPVAGAVRVTSAGVDGDRQADLRVHGGPDKAVYAFSHDAYDGWPLAGADVPGAFGENLTIASFNEAQVYLGDRFAIGDCVLEVAQPRIPCHKLNARFNDVGAVRAFTAYRRPGVYFRVIQPGVITAGDAVEVIYRDPNRVSVLETWDLAMHRRMAPETAVRALAIPTLNPKLREKIERL